MVNFNLYVNYIIKPIKYALIAVDIQTCDFLQFCKIPTYH